MEIEGEIVLWAVGLGALSAVSLPLGALIGLSIRPPDRVLAALGAFGAGALLAALAVELVAPTLAELEMQEEGHANAVRSVLALIAGAGLGGVVFVLLDRALSARGGFLRKTGSIISHFRGRGRAAHEAFLSDLCASSVLRRMPPHGVAELAHEVEPAELDGEILFEEGDPGDRLYFIRKGGVELSQAGRAIEELGPGDVVGELALLTGTPRAGGARALGALSVLSLGSEAVERARSRCPELDAALRELAGARLETFQHAREASRRDRDAWARAAIAALRAATVIPSPSELRSTREEHGGAGLAVWLGILLDGIPESIVIGASFAALVAVQALRGLEPVFLDLIPYTLIAGLFLSNLPEALSSSIVMRAQGFSSARVLWMWLALMGITALGAGVGFAVSDRLPFVFVAGIEGLAAGAMLTAIASTMLPEAVHLAGGHLVGLGTLAGFLCAVAFKLLE